MPARPNPPTRRSGSTCLVRGPEDSVRPARRGWTLLRVGAVLALWMAVGGGAPLFAEDPPKKPVAPRIQLATVETDPSGEAERLAARAQARRLAGEHLEALADLVHLAEKMPEVPIPLSSVIDGASPDDAPGIRQPGALRWPAVRAANLGLARLDAKGRDALAERWQADAQVLEKAAGRGNTNALEQLARRFGALEEGRRAQRLLADLAFESGDYATSCRWLQAWVWGTPDAEPAELAAVVAAWADALHGLDDAGGIAALARRFASLAAVRVKRGGASVRLDRILAAKRAASRRGPALGTPEVPTELVTIWSRPTHESGWYGTDWVPPHPDEGLVRAGVHIQDDCLVVHHGRRVVRLDARTGLERWQFPARKLPRLHTPRSRYFWHDLPMRTVTRAGDLVLVVLGEPGGTGSYGWRDEIHDVASLRDEVRLRLAALDVETGALRWTTGAHDERHPILGSLDVGVSSPPLVVGDRVYVTLGNRLGTGTYYAACLDRATGRPHWTRRLGAGTSGRGPKRADQDRFRHPAMVSLAWGARPSLAGDELCFVPHAGFAAGVDAVRGTLSWVRVLPRFGLRTRQAPGTGPSARNVPVAWGDAWLLAPLDCPHLVCLARGTGALRWTRGPDRPTALSIWRDLLHVGPDPEGRPGIWLSGHEGGLVLDARGVQTETLGGVDPATIPAARAPEGGRGLFEAGVLTTAWRGLLHATTFLPGRADKPGAVLHETELPWDAPDSADVHRVGAGWLLVGRQRIALVAGAADFESLLTGTHGKAPDDPAVRAVQLAIRGRRTTDADAFAEAHTRIRAIASPTTRMRVSRRVARELDTLLDDVWSLADDDTTKGVALRALQELEPQVWPLATDLRGPLLFKAARAWLALGKGRQAVELLDRWIAEPGTRLMSTDSIDTHESAVLQRPDLVAYQLLDIARRDHASARPALQRREAKHLASIRALGDAPTPVLHEAIRRAIGTEAAAIGRRRLIARHEAAGAWSWVAALQADLRLAPAARELKTAMRLQRNLARRQIAEARAWEAAGEIATARSLLADVARWAPPDVRDGRGGRLAEAANLLRDRTARKPSRRGQSTLDVWTHLEADLPTDDVKSVRLTGVRGPGATSMGNRVLIVRGLTPEIYDVESGARVAVLPGDDEGWFGGRLESVDVWVPGGGIRVSSIVPGEPADDSLVQAGDWIRTWNGQSVPDIPSFIRAVSATRPGAEIEVGIWRHGRRILDRFRAGRRPLAQPPGRLRDAFSALWTLADGRILFPARSGLDWIDMRAGTRTPLWRWDGAGSVGRIDVYGGEAYVTIERSGYDDVIVAIDLERGVQRWQTEVAGDVRRTRAVGSALWVDAAEPGWAWALDRRTGSIRFGVRSLMSRRDEFRRTLNDAHLSCGAPNGRGYAIVGSRQDPELYAFNTTTGRLDWSQSVGGQRARLRGGASGYLDPTLDADGVVAVVESPEVLRVILPSPLGEAPGEGDILLAGKNAISTDRAALGGPLSDDARVHVRGLRLHIVRNLWNRVTVFTVDVDASQMGARRTGQARQDPIVIRNNERLLTGSRGGGRAEPYLLDIVAEHDGLYLTGALFSQPPSTEVRFASHEGALRLLDAEMVQTLRHRPVRFGGRLLVPTDRGARVFRLVPLDKR